MFVAKDFVRDCYVAQIRAKMCVSAGPVSNLFKVGRQLNFLSYLGRNEKIILIFRRDARVTFKNVMRAPLR